MVVIAVHRITRAETDGCPFLYGKERKTMHYSMLIQGSPTNGTFIWINPYKLKNPYITSMTVLFRPKEAKAMFNNVDTTNVLLTVITRN